MDSSVNYYSSVNITTTQDIEVAITNACHRCGLNPSHVNISGFMNFTASQFLSLTQEDFFRVDPAHGRQLYLELLPYLNTATPTAGGYAALTSNATHRTFESESTQNLNVNPNFIKFDFNVESPELSHDILEENYGELSERPELSPGLTDMLDLFGFSGEETPTQDRPLHFFQKSNDSALTGNNPQEIINTSTTVAGIGEDFNLGQSPAFQQANTDIWFHGRTEVGVYSNSSTGACSTSSESRALLKLPTSNPFPIPTPSHGMLNPLDSITDVRATCSYQSRDTNSLNPHQELYSRRPASTSAIDPSSLVMPDGKSVFGSLPETLIQLNHGDAEAGFRSTIKSKQSRYKRRRPILYEFLADILDDPDCNPSIIKWDDEAKGVFRIMDQHAVANKWGQLKDGDCSYESFARALRYHYGKGKLVSVPERRFIFKFGEGVLDSIRLNKTL